MRVAILVDLGFFLPRYRSLIERDAHPPHTPKEVAHHFITGDSDFVPAAKLARREGLDVVLDPLRNRIAPSLHEHIDGLKSVWPKPSVLL